MNIIDTKVDKSMKYMLFLVAGLFIVNFTLVILYYQLDIIQTSITWYDMPLTHDQKIQTSITIGIIIAVITLVTFRGKLNE